MSISKTVLAHYRFAGKRKELKNLEQSCHISILKDQIPKRPTRDPLSPSPKKTQKNPPHLKKANLFSYYLQDMILNLIL